MHTLPHQFITPRIVLVAATAAVLSLAGCSDKPPRPDPVAEQMNAAATKPTMAAQDSFFDGKLLVEANLGRGFGGRGGPGGESGHRAGGHGRRRSGGDDGMSMGMGEGVGLGGGRHSGGGEDFESRGEGGPEAGGGEAPEIHEASMPPVALRLRLTNMSKEAVEVTFLLCKSDLGDFAVRPEKLIIAPEQSAQPEPMTSRLGLTSNALVLKVSLRLAGRVEQKDLVLKPIAVNEPTPNAKP